MNAGKDDERHMNNEQKNGKQLTGVIDAQVMNEVELFQRLKDSFDSLKVPAHQ
ncbi:MAG: hypothetical protein ACI32N_07935 [Bulleidia sp.]